jgi:hypothetical protein
MLTATVKVQASAKTFKVGLIVGEKVAPLTWTISTAQPLVDLVLDGCFGGEISLDMNREGTSRPQHAVLVEVERQQVLAQNKPSHAIILQRVQMLMKMDGMTVCHLPLPQL